MSAHSDPALDCPPGEVPTGEELIKAAMRWHFSPETGSAYWLRRARDLDFDPRTDVRTFEDLRRFPNVVDELRDVPVEDLIPRGYHGKADIFGVFESGGTTGPPKRVIYLADWLERYLVWIARNARLRGHPSDRNVLGVVPSGPHLFGSFTMEYARRCGAVAFMVDFDPRWVKKCLGEGRLDEAERYAEHVLAQCRHLLRTQDVGVLTTTPPLLERLARDDALVDLINSKVRLINWGGAHMNADTRQLLRTEVFPEAELYGNYSSTMALGGTVERMGLTDDDPCVFDPFSPYISFSVVDPDTGQLVDYGERGQVVMHHLSKAMLLPNNLERDLATRIEPPAGQLGDSVADVTPLAMFGSTTVIEGVY